MNGLEFGTFTECDSLMDKEDFVPPMYQQDISRNISIFTSYPSLDTNIAIDQLVSLQHFAESLEAFYILVTTLIG